MIFGFGRRRSPPAIRPLRERQSRGLRPSARRGLRPSVVGRGGRPARRRQDDSLRGGARSGQRRAARVHARASRGRRSRDPDYRGRGRLARPGRRARPDVARLRQAANAGVHAMFLEVDEHNAAAVALYRRLGFIKVGERPGYYRRKDGSRGARGGDAEETCRESGRDRQCRPAAGRSDRVASPRGSRAGARGLRPRLRAPAAPRPTARLARRGTDPGAVSAPALRRPRRHRAPARRDFRRGKPADRRQPRLLAGHSRPGRARADELPRQEGGRRASGRAGARRHAGGGLRGPGAPPLHTRGQRPNGRVHARGLAGRAVRRGDDRRRQPAAAFSLVAFRGDPAGRAPATENLRSSSRSTSTIRASPACRWRGSNGRGSPGTAT